MAPRETVQGGGKVARARCSHWLRRENNRRRGAAAGGRGHKSLTSRASWSSIDNLDQQPFAHIIELDLYTLISESKV